MKYEIKNWREFQHYKDRNPPWVKLHTGLLSSEDWVLWDNASRVLAVAIILLAPRNNGIVDGSSKGLLYLQRVAYLNEEPDLKPLVDSGFLVPLADASTMLADDTKCLLRDRDRDRDRDREDKRVATSSLAPPEAEPKKGAPRKPKPPDPPEPPGFREIWEAYPRRSGSQPRRPAQAAYQARVREGKITPEDALEAVQRYRAWCEATGKVGTETVMQAASFFGTQKEGYLQDWSLPSGPAGGGPRTFGQMKRENTKSATALVLRRLGECPENSESSLSPSKRVPYTEE